MPPANRKPMPDVIVLIPGIMGSVLAKDGKEIWSLRPGALFRGLLSLGNNLNALALQGDDPEALHLDDGVSAVRLMPDAHFVPGLWKIDAYTRVSEVVTSYFDVKGSQNYFEFPYDWRRDFRVAARRLRIESRDWLRSWREQSGNPEAKLILLAHSLGGLVARAFMEFEEDAQADTRMLISFGTPYAGSLNALNFLANGYSKGIGPIKLADLSETMRTFTSVYQLLPVYRCLDTGEPELQIPGEVSGIPNINQQKASEALELHRAINTSARSRAVAYDIRPIVGIDQSTLQGARLDPNRPNEIMMSFDRRGEDIGGDGTVPRRSATPIEWDGQERGCFFSSSRHASLQNTSAVLVQVQGLLTGGFEPTREWDPAISVRLGVQVNDWSAVREPIPVSIYPNQLYVDDPVEVRVRLEGVDNGTDAQLSVTKHLLPNEWSALELPPAPEGVYRLQVEALNGRAAPVVDLLGVFEPA